MWGKVLAVLSILAIVGTAGLVCSRIVTAYGEARYAAGVAEAQLKTLPQILAANQRADQAGLDARDRLISAEQSHAAELGRLDQLALASEREVFDYAQTAAGRAACLTAERVRGIAELRASLFPPEAPASAGGAGGGSLSAEPAAAAAGRRPE